MLDQKFKQLTEFYSSAGIKTGCTVYVSADMGKLISSPHEDRLDLLWRHLSAIQAVIGDRGVIVVPTATTNLCNTQILFDPASTPSNGMGAFSEFVRVQPAAFRSFHPFWSVVALGYEAEQLVSDLSRHAFGYGSIWSRLIEKDCISLHLGVHPKRSFSVVHYIELLHGVPYRYTKEFAHPVLREEKRFIEKFYHFVCYENIDLIRDNNEKIYDWFSSNYKVHKMKFGRGNIWVYPMRDFFSSTSALLTKDIYSWLRKEPTVRPYLI